MLRLSGTSLRNAFRKCTSGAAFTAAPVAFCLLGVAATGLSGCGFQPRDAYSKDYDLAKYLSRIQVAHIENRAGQIMRTEIKQGLNPTGHPHSPAFKLEVEYEITSSDRGTRIDDSAIQVDVRITADFKLSRIASDTAQGGVLLKSTSEAVTRKNNTDDLYASYVSTEEAEKRSARLVGQDIVRQIRLFFRYPNRYPQLKPDSDTKQSPTNHKRPQRQDFGPQ